MRLKDKYKKSIIIILIIALIILLAIFGLILTKQFRKMNFAKSNMEIYEKNKEQIFKIEKIILCSSANAINSIDGKETKDLSIYQYTDFQMKIQ